MKNEMNLDLNSKNDFHIAHNKNRYTIPPDNDVTR